jgi:hypothetical protein
MGSCCEQTEAIPQSQGIGKFSQMPSGLPDRFFCALFPLRKWNLACGSCDKSAKWNGRCWNVPPIQLLNRIINFMEDMMTNRLAASIVAASLLASGAAFAQSTTVEGARGGAAAGGSVAGPVGEAVGGTVGAAVGLGLEIPNAVITSIQGERAPSVTVRERVVVGEVLPSSVQLRTVPSHTEYRYAVVNDRRVIVEPRTRKVIKIID